MHEAIRQRMSDDMWGRQRSPAAAGAMYQRVLASWASDVLRLRRAGLDRPTRRTRLGAVLSAERASRSAA